MEATGLSKRGRFPGGSLGIPVFQQLGLPRPTAGRMGSKWSETQTEGLLVSHLGSRDFFKNYCSENISQYLLIICFNVVCRNNLKNLFFLLFKNVIMFSMLFLCVFLLPSRFCLCLIMCGSFKHSGASESKVLCEMVEFLCSVNSFSGSFLLLCSSDSSLQF